MDWKAEELWWCCEDMEYHCGYECPADHNEWECPDIVMRRFNDWYGIPIHDGGTSAIIVKYCPWVWRHASGQARGRRGV